jgi:hypothetical protein
LFELQPSVTPHQRSEIMSSFYMVLYIDRNYLTSTVSFFIIFVVF